MVSTTRKIILASTSPRRKALLEQIGIAFTIVPSGYDEDMTLPMKPFDLAMHLAKGKAEAVANQHPESIVIGSDTIVVFDNKVIGKPKSPDEARKTLRMLNGQKNQVMTGLCVMCVSTGQQFLYTGITDVYLRDMSTEEIDAYVATGEPLDKAGSYALQDRGAIFVDRIDGNYSTGIGLPVAQVWQFLQQIS